MSIMTKFKIFIASIILLILIVIIIVYTGFDNNNRIMNIDNKSTAIVYCNGYAEGLEKEHLINYKNRGVRPAIWVKCK